LLETCSLAGPASRCAAQAARGAGGAVVVRRTAIFDFGKAVRLNLFRAVS
jgi:hypothetical protein